jgi:hypothetical protein
VTLIIARLLRLLPELERVANVALLFHIYAGIVPLSHSFVNIFVNILHSGKQTTFARRRWSLWLFNRAFGAYNL